MFLDDTEHWIPTRTGIVLKYHDDAEYIKAYDDLNLPDGVAFMDVRPKNGTFTQEEISALFELFLDREEVV